MGGGSANRPGERTGGSAGRFALPPNSLNEWQCGSRYPPGPHDSGAKGLAEPQPVRNPIPETAHRDGELDKPGNVRNHSPIVLSGQTELDLAGITARSEDQVMDWSLVLASQGISATIERSDPDGWLLVVEPHEHDVALRSISLYEQENRKRSNPVRVEWSKTPFHRGVLYWCMLLALVFEIDKLLLPSLGALAQFDSAAVTQGEWWRLVSAVFLHADLPHLISNLTTGFVLVGLAMGAFGAGCALLSTLLAGAIGNLCGLLLYHAPYHGLGASGMVMGALGMISVLSLRDSTQLHSGLKFALKGILGGMLLLVILGTNPSSDVIAHVGGFFGGIGIGGILTLLPGSPDRNRTLQRTSWVVLTGILAAVASLVMAGL